MKDQNLIFWIIGGILVALLVGSQLGLLAIITNTTSWVDKEEYATFDGIWQTAVQNAFDENWQTSALSVEPGERNIYETTRLNYPENAQPDYLEFFVTFSIATHPETPTGYSILEYFVWNYQTLSWDPISIYYGPKSYDSIPEAHSFQASVLNHIKDNLIKLRTNSRISYYGMIAIFESKARLVYTLDVDCEFGETKCAGVNNKEYFTCENYNWTNQGFIIGECDAECISNTDCQVGYKCESSECVLDLQGYYRLENNTCNLINLSLSEVTSFDYDTHEECQEHISNDCYSYYWFDDTHNACGFKEFCGEFIYPGLRVFITLGECESVLRGDECIFSLGDYCIKLWMVLLAIGGLLIILIPKK